MAVLVHGDPIMTQGHLENATNYSENDKKTLVDEWGDLVRAIEYSENPDKTLVGDWLVSGINCDREHAAQEMNATKKKFGKQGGILAHRYFLSFVEDEVTPQVAHEIGVRWAAALWGDKFEIVCSTHCNTDNIHCDYVVNSVSFKDGGKLHRPKGFLENVERPLVDKLCREYGISKIPPLKRDRGKTPDAAISFDKVQHYSDRISKKQMIINDIESCIKQSFSIGDAYVQLENRGYVIDLSGQSAKIGFSGNRPWRFDSLGYSADVLARRIEGKLSAPPPHPAKANKFVGRSHSPAKRPRHKLTRFEAMYLHWLHKLGKARKHPTRARISKEEYHKFNEYKKQLHYVAEHGISSKQDAAAKLSRISENIKALDAERFKLMGAHKKHKELFSAHAVYKRYSMLQGLTPEESARFNRALQVLDSRGYGNNPRKLDKMRVSLSDALSTNRRQLNELKSEAKTLNAVLGDSEIIRAGLLKDRVPQAVPKQKSYVKEQEKYGTRSHQYITARGVHYHDGGRNAR